MGLMRLLRLLLQQLQGEVARSAELDARAASVQMLMLCYLRLSDVFRHPRQVLISSC